jgi:hypothetical protein
MRCELSNQGPFQRPIFAKLRPVSIGAGCASGGQTAEGAAAGEQGAGHGGKQQTRLRPRPAGGAGAGCGGRTLSALPASLAPACREAAGHGTRDTGGGGTGGGGGGGGGPAAPAAAAGGGGGGRGGAVRAEGPMAGRASGEGEGDGGGRLPAPPPGTCGGTFGPARGGGAAGRGLLDCLRRRAGQRERQQRQRDTDTQHHGRSTSTMWSVVSGQWSVWVWRSGRATEHQSVDQVDPRPSGAAGLSSRQRRKTRHPPTTLPCCRSNGRRQGLKGLALRTWTATAAVTPDDLNARNTPALHPRDGATHTFRA